MLANLGVERVVPYTWHRLAFPVGRDASEWADRLVARDRLFRRPAAKSIRSWGPCRSIQSRSAATQRSGEFGRGSFANGIWNCDLSKGFARYERGEIDKLCVGQPNRRYVQPLERLGVYQVLEQPTIQACDFGFKNKYFDRQLGECRLPLLGDFSWFSECIELERCDRSRQCLQARDFIVTSLGKLDVVETLKRPERRYGLNVGVNMLRLKSSNTKAIPRASASPACFARTEE